MAAISLPPVILFKDADLAPAAHLGLVMDMPTIGVAKSRLVGEGVEPDLAAGSFNVLIWKENRLD